MSEMTQAEITWCGDFGRKYHERNTPQVEANERLFARMLAKADPTINSFVEFGAGTGQNIRAMRTLYPYAKSIAVEINHVAAENIEAELTICESMLTAAVPVCDLAFTKGVLIHIDPGALKHAYEALYKASSRYILLCEYYNPVQVEVTYRGNSGLLWKRDFAGDMLDKYPLHLLDYGFSYDRDPNMPGDNFNWFLLEIVR